MAGDPLHRSSAYSYISDEALLSLDSMEGIHELPKATAPKPKPQSPPWLAYVPAILVTAAAYGLHYLPVPPFRVVAGAGARYPVSAAIVAIVAGVLVRNLLPLPGPVIESAKGDVYKRQVQRATKTPATMPSEITNGENPAVTSLVGASAAASQEAAASPQTTPRVCSDTRVIS